MFGLSRETAQKTWRFSLPPGYTRMLPISRPKLDQSAPAKQRHTAKRIFERLRDEHGFAGGYTVVRITGESAGLGAGRRSCRCRIRRGMPRA